MPSASLRDSRRSRVSTTDRGRPMVRSGRADQRRIGGRRSTRRCIDAAASSALAGCHNAVAPSALALGYCLGVVGEAVRGRVLVVDDDVAVASSFQVFVALAGKCFVEQTCRRTVGTGAAHDLLSDQSPHRDVREVRGSILRALLLLFSSSRRWLLSLTVAAQSGQPIQQHCPVGLGVGSQKVRIFLFPQARAPFDGSGGALQPFHTAPFCPLFLVGMCPTRSKIFSSCATSMSREKMNKSNSKSVT